MSEWNFDPPEGITNRETGLLAILKTIRYDLTAAQGKVTDLMNLIRENNLDELPAKVKCPTCGLACKGPRTLAEHLHTSHDGPLPDHWAEDGIDRTAEVQIREMADEAKAALAALGVPETEVTA